MGRTTHPERGETEPLRSPRAPRGATAGVRQSLSFRALSPARPLHAGGDMRALLGAGVDAQSESEKKRKKLQKASC